MKRPVSWLYCSSSCLVTLFLNMFNICSTVIVMFQQYTCDGLCIIICSSYLEGDLQTLSLFLHFVFGSHMAKTKPSAKSQPKKPLATPAKQFTAGRTKPVTKLSKKPAATSLSTLMQQAEESIGSRCEKRDDSPQFQDYSSFRTFTDAVAISMVSPCSSAMTASSHARLFFRRCQETQPELRSWRRWHHIQQFQSAAWSMNVTL